MAEVVEILKKIGAIITDSHIVGTSGRHMSVYLNKDRLFPYPDETSHIGRLFAEKYQDHQIEVVVAPAQGGIILSQWVAYHLGHLTQRLVHGVYTEKTADNQQIFRRGYDQFVTGKRVLVIEDLTTTGGSVKKTIESVRAVGGEVIEACVMVNRDQNLVNAESIGAPFAALDYFPAESYPADECPLCQAGVPINTTVGHGQAFLAQHRPTS